MSNEIKDIPILYEDDNIAAINKPSGLMVHPDGRAAGPFLTDWIAEKFPGARLVGEPARAPDGSEILRPGIVHRLDRETSGVLLVAKTTEGHACLKKQFQERTIKKKYIAFVWGEMEEDFGTIDRPIGRSGSDFRKWSAQRGARGEMRSAETYWSKLGTCTLSVNAENGEKGPENGAKRDQKFTLLEAEPKTGRTHQIRVHFAAIQHPVVSDILYNPSRPSVLGFSRTALHARSIEFTTCEGKRVKIEAPLPEDFSKAVDECSIKLKI